MLSFGDVHLSEGHAQGVHADSVTRVRDTIYEKMIGWSGALVTCCFGTCNNQSISVASANLLVIIVL